MTNMPLFEIADQNLSHLNSTKAPIPPRQIAPDVKKLLIRQFNGETNIEDKGTPASIEVARRLFDVLGIRGSVPTKPKGQTIGREFEEAISRFVMDDPNVKASTKGFHSSTSSLLTDFSQYSHLLSRYQPIIGDTSGNIWDFSDGSNIYLIPPDIAVSSKPDPHGDRKRVLHAVISCKWTVRVSHSQSVHREGSELLCRRRGRTPHMIVVTAEPQPSRLAALTSGDGTIDMLYHVALPELQEAVRTCQNPLERKIMELLMRGGKIADLSQLPARLVHQ